MTVHLRTITFKKNQLSTSLFLITVLTFLMFGRGKNDGYAPGEVRSANCSKQLSAIIRTVVFKSVQVPTPGNYYFKTLTILATGEVIKSEVGELIIE